MSAHIYIAQIQMQPNCLIAQKYVAQLSANFYTAQIHMKPNCLIAQTYVAQLSENTLDSIVLFLKSISFIAQIHM